MFFPLLFFAYEWLLLLNLSSVFIHEKEIYKNNDTLHER